jgi:general secretion pathway protein M
MSTRDTIERHLARFPLLAAAVYVALVLTFGWAIWGSVVDILDHRSAVAATSDILARLQRHRSAPVNAPNIIAPTGSAFLEGPTVTVAGAALLQRVTSAVTKAGGSVLSSQVNLQSAQSKAGLVGVIASCELNQPDLQQLLYDLEAGMPFLFVQQLVVQAPAALSGAQHGRLRVQLTVYGQWQGGK